MGTATFDFASDLNATTTSPVTSGAISNGSLTTLVRTSLTYASAPVLQVAPPASTTTPSAAITNNSYYQIALTGSGSLKRIRFGAAKGGSTSNRGFAVRTSDDSYAADVMADLDINSVRPTLTQYDQAVDIPFTAGALTLRVFVHAPSSASTAEYDDIILDVEDAASGPVGLATSTSTAFALAPVQILPVGLATSTSTAFNLARLQIRTVGFGQSTSSALALTSLAIRDVGRADEADAALARTAASGVVFTPAVETDLALALAAVSIPRELFVREPAPDAIALSANAAPGSGSFVRAPPPAAISITQT